MELNIEDLKRDLLQIQNTLFINSKVIVLIIYLVFSPKWYFLKGASSCKQDNRRVSSPFNESN